MQKLSADPSIRLFLFCGFLFLSGAFLSDETAAFYIIVQPLLLMVVVRLNCV